MIWLLLLCQERETHWILETKVSGALVSEYSGDYPFEYEGWTTLTSAEIDTLKKDGDVPKGLALAFAEPEPEKREGKDPRALDPKTTDEISDVSFTVKDGTIRGKLTLLRKEGAGTRKIALELGYYDDPRERLMRLNRRLLRAARVLPDVSIHTGRMTFEEAADFLVEKVRINRAQAVPGYTMEPTYYSSYMLGMLEIFRIRGKFRLPMKEFHERLLRFGNVPPSIIEEELGRE